MSPRTAKSASKHGLKIGWASVDVTPPKPCLLCGQFHLRISTSVHDPLTATALALEAADGSQSVVVSVDALWVSDYVRARFDARLPKALRAVSPDRVLISGTHTHTSPTQPSWFDHRDLTPPAGVMRPQEYGDFLADRLVALVVEAWKNRQPGGLGWGLGHAVVGYNRRASYEDGTTVMYGSTNHPLFTHVEGHENHGLDLLVTYDSDRKPTGVLINVCCPSQCTEGANFVSADFWHDTREELRRQLGSDLHVLAQCGAGGDQSPHLILQRAAQERMLRLQGLLPEQGGDFNMAQRQEIARRITAAVVDILPAVGRDIHFDAPIRHVRTEIALPRRRLTPTDVRTGQERVAQFTARREALRAAGADPLGAEFSSAVAQVQYYAAALAIHAAIENGTADSLPVDLHAVRIGDIALCSNRFEFGLDFAERIKARSPAVQTFIVQLAGEGTYLATARSEHGGGYGAWFASTLLGSDSGARIVEKSLAMIRDLFATGAATRH